MACKSIPLQGPYIWMLPKLGAPQTIVHIVSGKNGQNPFPYKNDPFWMILGDAHPTYRPMPKQRRHARKSASTSVNLNSVEDFRTSRIETHPSQ